MNGTIVDIQGITVNVTPIELNGSTDKAYLLYISDGVKEVAISISYGKINEIKTK